MNRFKYTELFFLLSIHLVYSQPNISKIDCIQGIWQNIPGNINYQNEIRLIINKGKKQLFIYYDKEKVKSTFCVYEHQIGFTNSLPSSNEILRKDIIDNGKYFLTIDNIQQKEKYVSDEFSIEPNFGCDNEMYYYSNSGSGSPFDHYKLNKLPDIALDLLISKYKNKFDYYVNGYTKQTHIKISSPKSFFHSTASDSTKRKSYLIKGDKATLLEEKGDWYYVEYKGTKTIKGWIKKADVEILK